jgi:aminoglycoside phosphotransferase (APT) family kinase protein
LAEMTRESLAQHLDNVVAHLGPVLGSEAIARAARAIAEGWHALDGAAPATLHGDFHARNVLVERHAASMRACLIDLDGLRRGPALLELGAWIGDRMYLALLEGADARRDEATWRALIDAYVAAGGKRPDAQALRWATAWSLFTQRAWRCVVNLKPGRFALAPRLVELAGELIGVKETAPC